MPDGRVEWFDPHAGEARISHSGREYPARADDMEPAARVAGARVHFDIARDDGVERAVGVRILEGTRTGKRQRRFGDLAGAHHPPDKGSSTGEGYRRPPQPSLTGRPREVVDAWVDAVAASDIDTAVGLYAPDATWHEGEQQFSGRDAIRRRLQDSALAGARPGGVEIKGTADDRFVVLWRPLADEEAAVVSTFRVAHGEIAEQWTEEAS